MVLPAAGERRLPITRASRIDTLFMFLLLGHLGQAAAESCNTPSPRQVTLGSFGKM
jgi:hypothetical protein